MNILNVNYQRYLLNCPAQNEYGPLLRKRGPTGEPALKTRKTEKLRHI